MLLMEYQILNLWQICRNFSLWNPSFPISIKYINRLITRKIKFFKEELETQSILKATHDEKNILIMNLGLIGPFITHYTPHNVKFIEFGNRKQQQMNSKEIGRAHV